MKNTLFKKLKFPFIILLLILGFFVAQELILAYSGCGLKAYDGTELIEFACEEPGSVVSPLRIFKDGEIYGIPLVNTYNQYASNFRIMTGNGVKALRKMEGPYDETSNWGVEFIGDTESIEGSYYDFFPGGLSDIPIDYQPETIDVFPFGDPANDVDGGAFITYIRREVFGADVDQKYTYIPPVGNSYQSAVSWDDLGDQGYFSSSVDIDPITGNPFIMSVGLDDNNDHTSFLSFDNFNFLGATGFWSQAVDIISHETDIFMETQIDIDSSPLSGYRRIYAHAVNKDFSNSNYGSGGFGRIVLAYNDFDYDYDIFDIIYNDEWVYQTVPYFDTLESSGIISYKAGAVQDNRIAFMGYNEDNEIFVVYNDNYGEEGQWDIATQLMEFDIEDIGDNFACDNLYASFKFSQNMNVIFDNEGNLHMTGAMGVYTHDSCSFDTSEYVYVKHFVYNFDDGEFHFNNVYPSGNYDIDDIYVPGDDNNDDVYDGNVIKYFPIFHPDNNHPQNYNNYRIVSSEDKEYLLAVWQNSIKGKTYSQWRYLPQIVFSISSNNGRTWSDPIIMHANSNSLIPEPDMGNYFSELDGDLPEYIYPSDDFEVTYGAGNEVSFEVLMFYFDDNSLGSYEKFGEGSNGGGQLRYADLKFTGTLD